MKADIFCLKSSFGFGNSTFGGFGISGSDPCNYGAKKHGRSVVLDGAGRILVVVKLHPLRIFQQGLQNVLAEFSRHDFHISYSFKLFILLNYLSLNT